MSEMRPLALVTGGMRRLGAVIAARLANEGYDLALSSHVAGEPDGTLKSVIDTTGAQWHCFVRDLGNMASAPLLIQDVTAHFGRTPDLLVNNAAMFGQGGWQDMDADNLDAHFRLNLFAPLLLSKELVRVAGETAQPAIIHIVDQRIVNPHADQLSYTLSKQALAASVRSMASAFGRRARVNGVAPGLVIATDDYAPGQTDRLADLMPLGELATPQAIADAVAYLASARHVTGQIIFVDGGANLKSFDRDFMYL
jgi:pteridine reductase